jgi:hypothetical protein
VGAAACMERKVGATLAVVGSGDTRGEEGGGGGTRR